MYYLHIPPILTAIGADVSSATGDVGLSFFSKTRDFSLIGSIRVNWTLGKNDLKLHKKDI